MLPRSPCSVTAMDSLGRTSPQKPSPAPKSSTKGSRWAASMLNSPQQQLTRRCSTATLPPVVSDKYRNPHRDKRVRNDFKLLYELNKKLILITDDVERVMVRKNLFPEKKERIVTMQDHATTLVASRSEASLPKIDATISQPFGLQDFLMELSSYCDDG